AIMRFVEEIDQSLGDDRSNALDGRQFGLRIFGHGDMSQLLDRAEAFEQVFRGHDADVADAEAEEEARSVWRTFCLDGGEEVVDRLLLPPLTAEQFVTMLMHPEDVGGRR